MEFNEGQFDCEKRKELFGDQTDKSGSTLGKVFGIITVVPTIVFCIWCTVIAFAGGRIPLIGWQLKGGVVTGVLWVVVVDPVFIGIAYLASMLLLLVVAVPFGITTRRRTAPVDMSLTQTEAVFALINAPKLGDGVRVQVPGSEIEMIAIKVQPSGDSKYLVNSRMLPTDPWGAGVPVGDPDLAIKRLLSGSGATVIKLWRNNQMVGS